MARHRWIAYTGPDPHKHVPALGAVVPAGKPVKAPQDVARSLLTQPGWVPAPGGSLDDEETTGDEVPAQEDTDQGNPEDAVEVPDEHDEPDQGEE